MVVEDVLVVSRCKRAWTERQTADAVEFGARVSRWDRNFGDLGFEAAGSRRKPPPSMASTPFCQSARPSATLPMHAATQQAAHPRPSPVLLVMQDPVYGTAASTRKL